MARRTKEQILRERAAYHEAGHVFMCWYCGVKVHHASAMPGPVRGTQGYVRCEAFDWTLPSYAWPNWRYAEDDIRVCLAGASAYWRSARGRVSQLAALFCGGRSDFAKAEAIARRYLDESDVGRYLDAMAREVNSIVSEPENWKIIEHIAQRLLRADVVSGTELAGYFPSYQEWVERLARHGQSAAAARQKQEWPRVEADDARPT